MDNMCCHIHDIIHNKTNKNQMDVEKRFESMAANQNKGEIRLIYSVIGH